MFLNIEWDWVSFFCHSEGISIIYIFIVYRIEIPSE